MRRRYRRKKRKIPFIFILLAMILFIIYLYYFTDKRVKPIVMELSEIKARLIATQAINDAVSKVMDDRDTCELTVILKDNNGKIAGLYANTIEITKIAGETVKAVQSEIENIGTQKLKIPISNVLGSQLLANTGPRIGINVLPAGSVSINYFTSFESAGINQSRYKIYLAIKTSVRIIAPLGTNLIDVENNIPVAETIIVGDVPQSYIDVPENNNDYLNFVPTHDPFNN